MKVYQKIARELDRFRRCKGAAGKWSEFADDADSILADIERDILPSGSGFDSGTRIDREESTAARIVLKTDFHHMNDGGFYDGWTQHRVILTPTFDGFDMRVTGKDKRQIKEYIGDTFHAVLNQEYNGRD